MPKKLTKGYQLCSFTWDWGRVPQSQGHSIIKGSVIYVGRCNVTSLSNALIEAGASTFEEEKGLLFWDKVFSTFLLSEGPVMSKGGV